METLTAITAWLGAHLGVVTTTMAVLWEIVGRLAPTEKRASIFSWVGKLLKGIGDICFVISDAIGKVIPDNRK